MGWVIRNIELNLLFKIVYLWGINANFVRDASLESILPHSVLL